MTDEQIREALRAFPRALVLAMNGSRKLTWQEFVDAHDRYEDALAALWEQTTV